MNQIVTLDKILSTKKGNTITKYPSISTYHAMKKGKLSDEITHEILNTKIYKFITEKIDGMNIRILVLNEDYVIGSREEFIYAKGDRVISEKEKNKIELLKGIAEQIIFNKSIQNNVLYCFYGEFYGSKIQKNWKHYTLHENDYDYRIFDVWKMEIHDFSMLYQSFTIDEASSWKEAGKQPWMDMYSFIEFVDEQLNLKTVPFLDIGNFDPIGTTIQEAYQNLQKYRNTNLNLDSTDKLNSKAEGIVVRTSNRKHIAKLRFEDYE